MLIVSHKTSKGNEGKRGDSKRQELREDFPVIPVFYCLEPEACGP